MDGSNSLLFYFLEIINTELKDVSLFRELINKIDFRYKIIFGEPIYPNEFDENIDKQTEIMQKYVEYELGKPPSVI
jgi:putative hemolysin